VSCYNTEDNPQTDCPVMTHSRGKKFIWAKRYRAMSYDFGEGRSCDPKIWHDEKLPYIRA